MPYFNTSEPHICTINLKMEVNMWLAVLIFVGLSVEVLSYLSGGEMKTGNSPKEAP